MDPIAVSFVVFFSLFMGGFLFLICLGCLIHCCCTMDVPRYRGEVTDEAIVCERLTRKERLAVIEKVFSNYDSLGRFNNTNQERDLEEGTNNDVSSDKVGNQNSNRSLAEQLCVICLDHVGDIFTSPMEQQQQQKEQGLSPFAITIKSASIPTPTSTPCTSPTSSPASISSPKSIRKDNPSPIIRGWNCNHIYHKECIQPWLEQGKISCPCCRQDLLNPDDFRHAVTSVLRKERLHMMRRWGIKQELWTEEDGEEGENNNHHER
eukprot:61065_1